MTIARAIFEATVAVLRRRRAGLARSLRGETLNDGFAAKAKSARPAAVS
jgi:hypothetical protein